MRSASGKYVSLTKPQKQTLSAIELWTAREGKSPTISELAEHLSLRSLRSVTQRLDVLERKGLIVRNKFKHRGIELVGPTTFSSYEDEDVLDSGFIRIPVIASAGCDALDVFAEQEFDEYIMVERSLVKARQQKTTMAAIRAVGDSMLDAGIHSGDYVIVEVTEDAEPGDRVVAVVGNMAVIKRFDRIDDLVYLMPENGAADYMPIIVREDNSRIFGKVLSIIPGTEWVDDIRIEYYSER